MAKRVSNTDPVVDGLKDILILHLAIAGVKRHAIRKVVGCAMTRVTQISRVLKTKSLRGKGQPSKTGG